MIMAECPQCHAPLADETPLGVCPACLLEGATRKESLREEVDLGFLDDSDQVRSLGRFADYEVVEVLGQGATGIVLKAEDPALRRMVAIKVLHPVLATSPLSRERFVREARAAAAVSNDHVVTLHAVSEWKELPYLVMEYVSGTSLEARIREKAPLDLREVLRIAQQMANGLAAAHKQGLVHRDIKPGNVLLENGVERVKLTDFGLARAQDEAGLTLTGFVTGTPEYMAPEQVEGEKVDHRTDLYALGAVVYAMAAGEPPHRGQSMAEVLHGIVHSAPDRLAEQNRSVPRWLDRIVQRLMAKRPGDRLESAEEAERLFRERLSEVQRGTWEEEPSKRLDRKIFARRSAAVATVALLAMLGGAGWVLWSGLNSRRETESDGSRAGRPLQTEDDSLQSSSARSLLSNQDIRAALLQRLDWINSERGMRRTVNAPDLDRWLEKGAAVRFLRYKKVPPSGRPVPIDKTFIEEATEKGLPSPEKASYVILVIAGKESRRAKGAVESLLRKLNRENPPGGGRVGRLSLEEVREILPAERRAPGSEVWMVYPPEDEDAE